MPARSWIIILLPLLLAVLLSFHPAPGGDVIYDGLRDEVTPWLVVHFGLAVGVGVMAYVVYQLLRGLTGRAATISRYALVLFVPCFLAWEGNVGIGTGFLVEQANGLPAGAERAAASADIQDHFTDPIVGDASVLGTIANGAWIVAVIAAGFAVRRARAGMGAVVALCLASLFTLHAIITGPIGLVCLAAGVALVELRRARGAFGARRPAVVTGAATVRGTARFRSPA